MSMVDVNNESIIKGLLGTWWENGWQGWWTTQKDKTVDLGVFSATVVMQDQDDNDDTEMVFRVDIPNAEPRYFRKEGWVDSYENTEWGGVFQEVVPEERTVTVYKVKAA